jgi:hypothetical protein
VASPHSRRIYVAGLVHGKVPSIVVGGLVTATIDGLAFPFNFLPAIRGASTDLESRTVV